MVADLHHFNADPDTAFYFNADPDRTSHFSAGTNPDPVLLFLKVMRISDHWSRDLYDSTFSLKSSRILTLMRILIQLFTLMRIRIQISKTMRIRSPNPAWNFGHNVIYIVIFFAFYPQADIFT